MCTRLVPEFYICRKAHYDVTRIFFLTFVLYYHYFFFFFTRMQSIRTECLVSWFHSNLSISTHFNSTHLTSGWKLQGRDPAQNILGFNLGWSWFIHGVFHYQLTNQLPRGILFIYIALGKDPMYFHCFQLQCFFFQVICYFCSVLLVYMCTTIKPPYSIRHMAASLIKYLKISNKPHLIIIRLGITKLGELFVYGSFWHECIILLSQRFKHCPINCIESLW